MKFKLISISLFMLSQLSWSQGINVSGTVSDGQNQSVEGAVVKLQTSQLADTTGSDGSFLISDGSSSIFSSEGSSLKGISAHLTNGKIILNLASAMLLEISAYNAKGKLANQFRQNFQSGESSLNISNWSKSAMFYKISSPQGELVLKNSNLPSNSNQALAKAAAPDVLVVSKEGYVEKQINLTSTDTSGVDVMLQEEADLEPFSFFVTSLKAMQQLSGSQAGFGGDLTYGETGPGAGLKGADKICSEIAEMTMPGSSAKVWRAFLSVEDDGEGNVVNAIDRIGDGPWYDRLGRIVSENRADLLNDRPASADPTIKADLPNEEGIPNRNPDLNGEQDNHHILTGSNGQGELYTSHNYPSATCHNWTSSEPTIGTRPRIGFSWQISNRIHWISGQDEGGCGAGIDVDGGGGSDPNNPIVGSGGGYGGIYCFALSP